LYLEINKLHLQKLKTNKMKAKIFIVAVLLATFLTSCKNGENKETSGDQVEKLAVKENFNVEVDVIAQTQDDFTIYYSEDNTNVFSGGKAIWCGVKGGLTPEKVVFDLPEQIVPTNIRLDFGIKKDHKDVIIQNIKLAFYDRVFNIKGSEFLNYFIVNDKIITTVDVAKGTITLKVDPLKNDGTYYYPRQELLDQIAKMTK
jgi:hypothetical protein